MWAQLWNLSIWMVVAGVLGLFVWPSTFWVWLGAAGALLFCVVFAIALARFSPSDWLADVIRRSRR